MHKEPEFSEDEEKPDPPITPEDVDKHGLIIRIKGEDRFWVGESENPEVYDYRAGRFLTSEEAAHRLRSLDEGTEPGTEE